MQIMRIFPRWTNATPDDSMIRINELPNAFDPPCDEVHISVTWTWDIPIAERLEKEWRHIAPVKMGGPAFGKAGESFTPGLYVKHGYTITSRGCPNRCWFCSAWKREGNIRELLIQEGWNILDDNLLACSDTHVKGVFAMLAKQKHKPEFTGGLEAKILKPWHCEELYKLRPKQLFFAFDTPDDYEPLVEAGKMLKQVGFKNHTLRAYVLCGYPSDTFLSATKRMIMTHRAGFAPMAMLYRDNRGDTIDGNNRKKPWGRFQRQWSNPVILFSNIKKLESNKRHT